MTGKIYWAKVLGAPVANYNKDGFEWTFDFVPAKGDLKLIAELGIKDKLKDKDDDRGTFLPFKQKEKRADGTPNFPITVVDARNRPWDPKLDAHGKVTNPIGNGSTVEVKFKVVDYGKGKPTGLYPQAIRVLDLAPYVRQEFAPLPEDNEYVRKFDDASFEEDSNVYDEDAPVEGDPLEG